MDKIRNFIIRGERNSGKSFLIKKIISGYNRKVKTAGFFTEKDNSGTVTFTVWDNFCLINNGPQMIIYDLNDKIIRGNVFEELGVWALNRALEHGSLLVMDELGRFEKDCRNFTRAVLRAFSSDLPIIAAMKKAENPFLCSILERKDILLLEIDPCNRTEVFNEINLNMNKLFPLD